MQTLKGLTLDKLVNLYKDVVAYGRKQIEERGGHRGTPIYEIKQRMLAQDKIILGTLKYAKANGLTGE